MSFLYLTADRLGIETGGGLVTDQEYTALRSMGHCELMDAVVMDGISNPFDQDAWFAGVVITNAIHKNYYGQLKLAHCYSGCLSETVKELQCMGVKISYTAAAHNVAVSRREHLALGIPYNYPHLTDSEQWRRYLEGYKQADLLICPSQHSAGVMRGFGCTNKIEVIPHGVNIPETVHPLPKTFTVGYLGACGGPDKGLRYLLAAWKKLNYTDAVLRIAGRDSTSSFVRCLVEAFGGGNIQLAGWQDKVSDFYAGISLYVQSSITEGFGIEVLEAMANGRAVLCSDGAGAADTVPQWYGFKAGDVDELATKIDQVRLRSSCHGFGYPVWQDEAAKYTWDKIRQRYVDAWQTLLRS